MLKNNEKIISRQILLKAHHSTYMELKGSYKVIIILEHCISIEVNGTVRYQVF